jgi:hypothetical protein
VVRALSHDKESSAQAQRRKRATAILFSLSLAKCLNHAATDALSSCRPERHVRGADGKADTGHLDGQRLQLQDNRPIRSAGNTLVPGPAQTVAAATARE